MAESNNSQPAAPQWDKFSKIFSQRNVAHDAKHIIPSIKPDSRIIDHRMWSGVNHKRTRSESTPTASSWASTIARVYRSFPNPKTQHNISNARPPNSLHHLCQSDRRRARPYQHHLRPREPRIPPTVRTRILRHRPRSPSHAPPLPPHPLLREMHRLVKPHTGLVAIRDNAFLHFHPSGPTMEENLGRFHATGHSCGAHSIGAGRVHHIWMHQAGFDRELIETGCEAFNYVSGGDPRLVRRRGY